MGVISKTILFATLSGACLASDVVKGTEDNFDGLIKEGLVLAEFYAPWCGHCKKLAPEWEKAATVLKGKATLVAVDATEETDLQALYEVQGFPTIKAFIDGEGPIEYDGGRTSDEIVAWVSKMSGPAVKDVADAAALEQLKKDNKVVCVGFFASKDSDEAVTFNTAAKTERMNYVFAAVYDADLAKAEEVTAPALVVYKQFDHGKDVLDKFNDKFLDFVKASSFPLLSEIGPENYKTYVERGLPLAWLFVDPSETDKTDAAKKAAEEVAKGLVGKASVVWLSGVQYGQMGERLGLSGKVWPSFVIDDQGEHYVFDESKEVAAEALGAWAKEWVAGKLSATVKSEAVPEQPTKDGLTTLVGSTFKDIVFDSSKNVFIKFYAPWCGHCKSMIPAYEELGKSFEDDDSVVIAKMDATANDAPKGFDVQGFPTLKFVKAGSNEIVDYQGGRDFDTMQAWIKAQK